MIYKRKDYSSGSQTRITGFKDVSTMEHIYEYRLLMLWPSSYLLSCHNFKDTIFVTNIKNQILLFSYSLVGLCVLVVCA